MNLPPASPGPIPGPDHQLPDGGAMYPCGRPLLEFPSPLKLIVLGATGSIGRQTLDLVRQYPDRLQVVAVSCHRDVAGLKRWLAELAEACPEAPEPLVAVADPEARDTAAREQGFADRMLADGTAGLVEAVTEPPQAHCLVNGLVGSVGLEPTLAAARRGLRIALANKESLVVGGDLVRRAVREHGAEILPVDSEHSAIAQCLSGRRESEIRQLILTASGGPFRQTSSAELERVTLQEVLNHPTWKMGPKITVDSATLMNKGLEVIEAHHLFGLGFDRISVVVHPGSIVHSLVEFVDGALLAQLGTPDMRIPLLYAIAGEKHWPLDSGRLDLVGIGTLRFEAPDLERFPCLALALAAGRAGGAAPIVLNAANETAVAALLAEKIRYAEIPRIIEESLAASPGGEISSLEEALTVDQLARKTAAGLIDRLDSGRP